MDTKVGCTKCGSRYCDCVIESNNCVYPRETSTPQHIVNVCNEIKELLLEKNRKYGDSAVYPSRIFSKADVLEQLNVRIDDKLSRIQSHQEDEDEDVEQDLIGYLVLKRVVRRIHG